MDNNYDMTIGKSFVDNGVNLNILLVDSDEDFRKAAVASLENMGFTVFTALDGDGMMRFCASGTACDAIVIEWNLPDRLGIDYLPMLREQHTATPVIILTSEPEIDHESLALDRGVDDFVDKSRGIEILAKRVRRIVLAQALPAVTDMKIQSERLLLKVDQRRAYWDGEDLDLTITEFNVLRRLVAHAGEHVTYRAIYDCVHGPGFLSGSGELGYRTNVRSLIKRIRNKFRLRDAAFDQIENFSAFGYRWREDQYAPLIAWQGHQPTMTSLIDDLAHRLPALPARAATSVSPPITASNIGKS